MVEAKSAENFAMLRRHMVDGQLRTCDVTDLTLLAAFDSVPRETFVAPAHASLAYLDRQVLALGSSERLLLAPMVLARLIQAARLRPGDKALDVAGGSGYSAMIFAALETRVVALESDAGAFAAAKTLTASSPLVTMVAGPLVKAAPGGPFDVILVNGAFERRPSELLDQLAPGGRLVGVDASFGAPKAVLIERIGGEPSRRVLFDAAAAKLADFSPAPTFAF
jgi:protein-L-isoaspartate(D-aspartate) O-methyltransferase